MAAQSRPNAGAMKAVSYSKATEQERDELQAAAFDIDRYISSIRAPAGQNDCAATEFIRSR